MKARIKVPQGYSARIISLKDSSPTEDDVELGSDLRITQEVPAGTQTARWFVGDVTQDPVVLRYYFNIHLGASHDCHTARSNTIPGYY